VSEFHDQIDGFVVLEEMVEGDDVFVFQLLVDFDLGSNAFLRFSVHYLFLEYFYCVRVVKVLAKVHISEASLAKFFAHRVVLDVVAEV